MPHDAICTAKDRLKPVVLLRVPHPEGCVQHQAALGVEAGIKHTGLDKP
jgi:hypothetical protein